MEGAVSGLPAHAAAHPPWCGSEQAPVALDPESFAVFVEDCIASTISGRAASTCLVRPVEIDESGGLVASAALVEVRWPVFSLGTARAYRGYEDSVVGELFFVRARTIEGVYRVTAAERFQ